MTTSIDAACSELQIMQMDFAACQDYVQDCADVPMSDHYLQCILIRMCMLRRNIDFLSAQIINDLNRVPLSQFLNPNKAENEAEN